MGKNLYYRRMESIIDSPYPQIDLLYMYPPPYILLYTYGNTIDVFGDVAFWYLHTKTFDSLSKRNTRNICDTKNDTKKTFLVRNSRTAWSFQWHRHLIFGLKRGQRWWPYFQPWRCHWKNKKIFDAQLKWHSREKFS